MRFYQDGSDRAVHNQQSSNNRRRPRSLAWGWELLCLPVRPAVHSDTLTTHSDPRVCRLRLGGAGLVGGALLMDAFEDHEDHEREEAYDAGECNALRVLNAP